MVVKVVMTLAAIICEQNLSACLHHLIAPNSIASISRSSMWKDGSNIKYQGLFKVEKQMFFNERKKATINRFFCIANDVLEMMIAFKIVNELVGDLYFHPDNDVADGDNQPILKANAMRLFQLDESDVMYFVIVKNPLRFWLVIDHTSSSLSFQQTVTVIEQHCVRTKNPKLMGLNYHMVSQFVHVFITVNLQMIFEIMSQPCVFAFSIVSDNSIHYESSYFDICIRMGINGVFHNMHIVIIPFYGRHIVVNMMRSQTP
jgi:hypothetical protein